MPKGKSGMEIDQRLRRAGRPATAVLSKSIITHAALRMLDNDGSQGLTMSRLAKSLGVRPSALYNHVESKDEVISGVRELISDRIDVSDFDTKTWDEAMLSWAYSYRAAFMTHPQTIALFATLPLGVAHRTTAMYETVTAALVRAGWPEEEVLSTIVAVESFILGSALDAVAPEDMFALTGRESTAPVFSSAYAAREAHHGGEGVAEHAFAIGIHALLAGLTLRYEEKPVQRL